MDNPPDSRTEFEVNLANDQAIKDDGEWQRSAAIKKAEKEKEARKLARRKQAYELGHFLNPLFVEAGFEMFKEDPRGFDVIGSWTKHYVGECGKSTESVVLEEERTGGNRWSGPSRTGQFILSVNTRRPTRYRADLEHAPGAIRRVNTYIEEKQADAAIHNREKNQRLSYSTRIRNLMDSILPGFKESESSWNITEKSYHINKLNGPTIKLSIRFSVNLEVGMDVSTETGKVSTIQILRNSDSCDLTTAFQMLKDLEDAA